VKIDRFARPTVATTALLILVSACTGLTEDVATPSGGDAGGDALPVANGATDGGNAGGDALSPVTDSGDAGDGTLPSSKDGGDAGADGPSLASDGSDASDGGDAPDGGDAAPLSVFYVDPAATPGSGKFQTITAALDAANSSLAPLRTIYVASGSYDTREKFPIILRDGTSLLGAGPGQTILAGSGGAAGVFGPSSLVSVPNVAAAIVVGDRSKTSRVAHLSLRGTGDKGSEGLVCDQGPTTDPGVTVANTLLDDVEIDGFEIDVRVTHETLPARSGCAMLLSRSTLSGGKFGVVADGVADNGSAVQRVSVQLGDANGDPGNVFQGFHVTTNEVSGTVFNGAGLVTLEAVTGVVVYDNHFQDSDQGIWSKQEVQPDAMGGMDIEANDFGPLFNAGIQLIGQPVVDKLLNNKFHEISTANSNGDFDTHDNFFGIGLIADPDALTSYPVLRQARGNSFFGNDIGVSLRSWASQVNASSIPIDFGTSSDPGNNTFRCNSSSKVRSNAAGGDVWMGFGDYAPSLIFSFEGNVWDHASPTTTPNSPAAAGIDVLLSSGVRALDTAKGTTVTGPSCPAGRVPGP
jgi:hypothetical protein